MIEKREEESNEGMRGIVRGVKRECHDQRNPQRAAESRERYQGNTHREESAESRPRLENQSFTLSAKYKSAS